MQSFIMQPFYRWVGQLVCLALVFLVTGLFAQVSLAADSTLYNQDFRNNSVNPTSDPIVSDTQFFTQTNHNVSGLFLQNFDLSGGIPINGLPLTEEFKDSTGMTIQVFERAILELHQPLEDDHTPQPAPYVEHKLLGVFLTTGRTFAPADPLTTTTGTRYFEATKHNLASTFGKFWDDNGGLAEFGYPLSEEFQETNPDDGNLYTVQYFERARFEYHPENVGTPYTVELGQLGKQYASITYDKSVFAEAKPQLLGPQKVVHVPSLMYHHIRDLTEPYDSDLNNYSVTPAAFLEQLDWLQSQGYHTVTVAQIADYLKYGVPLPAKPVNIRFDDGWQNQLWAANELKKRGMTATFFIITQATTYPYMTPAQIKALDAQGFEIASHTRNHPFLTRNSEDYDWAQIAGSKSDLEKLLGHAVRSFAYPYGDHAPWIDAMVRKAGYDIAASISWSENWKASNMFSEPAVSMSQMHTLRAFIARLNINY